MPEPLPFNRPGPDDRPDPLNRPPRRGVVQRFLGGSVAGTAVKLVVVSVLVGMAMRFFGWSPRDVLWAVEEALRDLWNTGFAALDNLAGYFLLGAAVVVPAFLVLRLLSFRR